MEEDEEGMEGNVDPSPGPSAPSVPARKDSAEAASVPTNTARSKRRASAGPKAAATVSAKNISQKNIEEAIQITGEDEAGIEETDNPSSDPSAPSVAASKDSTEAASVPTTTAGSVSVQTPQQKRLCLTPLSKRNKITCLKCGAQMYNLSRHLRTVHAGEEANPTGDKEETLPPNEDNSWRHRPQTTAARKKTTCPETGYGASVVNLSRHYRTNHPDTKVRTASEVHREERAAVKPPRKYKLMLCPIEDCGVKTCCLDQHLQATHKISKTANYRELLVSAKEYTTEMKGVDDLEPDEYRSSFLIVRGSGVERVDKTVDSHCTAVRTILKKIDSDAVLALVDRVKETE